MSILINLEINEVNGKDLNFDINEEIKDISTQEKLMNFRYNMNLKHNLLKFEIKIKGHRSI